MSFGCGGHRDRRERGAGDIGHDQPLLNREPGHGPGAGHYRATDPEDPGAAITRWSLTGTDAGDFTIDENGELTFRSVPDHERPADSGRDNVYNLSVRASDGRNYGYLAVTVTVEDVNEPPTITTTGRASFTYRENGKAALHTFRAADLERSAITWSVTGTDRDDFAISETGVLSFASPPDYESPADSGRDNVYEVTVVARDDSFNSGMLDVVVTVTDARLTRSVFESSSSFGPDSMTCHGCMRRPVSPSNPPLPNTPDGTAWSDTSGKWTLYLSRGHRPFHGQPALINEM